MMKFLVCLFLVLGTSYAAIPFKPDCRYVMCTMAFQICPDGTPAPIPAGACCPSLTACKEFNVMISRSSPLSGLGSILSGNNLLQTLSTATHGTNLGTAISILNLLNNLQQVSNDIHHIPLLINETITNILNGTGQATQVIIDQLIGAVTSAHQNSASRNLLDGLGSNMNLLSSISHLLPQGTSISTVISVLKLLNNINALTNDVHQIPVLLNQTISNIVGGAGPATQIIVQQLLNLIHGQSATSRNLLDGLGSNMNLLSSISHLLPQGTSISTVISVLKLLNNINALTNDVHQIPVLLNQTISNIVGGAGPATQIIVQQLLNLIGIQSQAASRDLLSALGQNGNLLSTVSHLLPQGTSISTVLSLLNLLSNVHALNNDLHQIPVVLQETLQNAINGIQSLVPTTSQ